MVQNQKKSFPRRPLQNRPFVGLADMMKVAGVTTSTPTSRRMAMIAAAQRKS